MQRRRFYAAPEQIEGNQALLDPDEAHHLIRVLRMRPGDEAFVFDGERREYRCRVTRIGDKEAQLEVLEELATVVESPLRARLAQALVKGDKFDWIVQKATELGVTSIVPLLTLNGDVKRTEERGERAAERWRRISLEALKQCGRRRLVRVHSPVPLGEFLQESPGDDLMLVFSERGGDTIQEVIRARSGLAVTALVGSEGGWADQELESLTDKGARMVTLGPRVLRTETAAIVALSLIQHYFGDLSR
jgi:16S rRNA (uracil1498-N3)-methyltransferase